MTFPSPTRRAALAPALAALTALQGCSSLKSSMLSNPTPIHATNPAAGSPSYKSTDVDVKAEQASLLVASRYYQALDKAAATGARQDDLDSYVSEGVALIELHCLRWFGRLEDAQRSLQVTETNRNVITQLGTTAIGLAKLNPIVTTAYGAANTAFTGFNANFDSAFLAAPNAENVKRLTLEAIGSRSAALRDPNASLYPRSFSAAYLQLEKLAGQCTFAEVKRLTTKSVDQARVSTDSKTGEAIVFSAATSEQATVLSARIGKLFERIDAIQPASATALVQIMPPRRDPAVAELVTKSDPGERRLKDDKVARAVLKRVIVETAKTEAAVSEWEDRLRLIAD